MQCKKTFPVRCDLSLSSCESSTGKICHNIYCIKDIPLYRMKTFTFKYADSIYLSEWKRKKKTQCSKRVMRISVMLNRFIHVLSLAQFVNRMKKMPQWWNVSLVILYFTTWNQIWVDQRHALRADMIIVVSFETATLSCASCVKQKERNKRKWKKCLYLHRVVIHLLCITVCLVRHQKRFDQILIETVSKASNGDMIYNAE